MNKNMIIAAALIVIVGVVAFVGGYYMAPRVTTGGAREIVTIKMVYWPGPESDALTPIIDEYNTYIGPSQGVKVELVLYGREIFWEKETTLLLAGSTDIDVAFVASYSAGKYAPYLVPLDEFIDNKTLFPATLDDWYQTTLDALTFKGHLYGIPHVGPESAMLYYRTDLISTPPETLDEFLTVAANYTRSVNPNSPTLYGCALQGMNLLYPAMVWHGVLASSGGKLFKGPGLETGGAYVGNYTPNFDSPEARYALGVYVNATQNGYAPPETSTMEYPQQNTVFQNQEAAMLIQWTAAYAELTNPELSPNVWNKTGFALIPGVRQQDGSVLHMTYVNTWGPAINNASLHKEECFGFLAWLCTQYPMLQYTLNGGRTPLYSVFNNPEVLATRPDIAGPFKDIFAGEGSFPGLNLPESLDIYSKIAQHLSAAVAGSETVTVALQGMNTDVFNLLDEAGYYD